MKIYKPNLSRRAIRRIWGVCGDCLQVVSSEHNYSLNSFSLSYGMYNIYIRTPHATPYSRYIRLNLQVAYKYSSTVSDVNTTHIRHAGMYFLSVHAQLWLVINVPDWN